MKTRSKNSLWNLLTFWIIKQWFNTNIFYFYFSDPTSAAASPASEKKGHSLPFPPSQNPPQTQGPSPQQPPKAVEGPSPATPAQSCSHCSLPTTTTRRPLLTDLAVVSKDQVNNQFGGQAPGNSQYPQGAQNYPGEQQNYPAGQSNYPGQDVNGSPGFEQQYPQGGSGQNYPQQGAGENYPQPNYPQGPGESQSNYPQFGAEAGPNYPQQGPNYSQQGPGGPEEYPQSGAVQSPGQTLQTPFGANTGDRNPKQFSNYPNGPQGGNGPQSGPEGNQGPSKPTLISAQMQIVDRNTDIHHKNPGEKDGLPDGLTKNDMLQLLYTFNYTVGFHGHYEEGYTNGAKQGYYFITGRNGVRTRVDYVADEKGFRPKISQEVLDLLSDDVPKPETEKDEKYGLKGYEFKWLYYPVDTRKR